MKKILTLLAVIVFVSCNKKEKPEMIEGEILKVTIHANPMASINALKFIAEIDAKQDGKKETTDEIEITSKLANHFTSIAGAECNPFFVRIKRNIEGKYEFKELALVNWDVVALQPWYQFQSDKKLIGN